MEEIQRTITITLYITKDGAEFEDRYAAVHHEENLADEEEYNNFKVDFEKNHIKSTYYILSKHGKNHFVWNDYGFITPLEFFQKYKSENTRDSNKIGRILNKYNLEFKELYFDIEYYIEQLKIPYNVLFDDLENVRKHKEYYFECLLGHIKFYLKDNTDNRAKSVDGNKVDGICTGRGKTLPDLHLLVENNLLDDFLQYLIDNKIINLDFLGIDLERYKWSYSSNIGARGDRRFPVLDGVILFIINNGIDSKLYKTTKEKYTRLRNHLTSLRLNGERYVAWRQELEEIYKCFGENIILKMSTHVSNFCTKKDCIENFKPFDIFLKNNPKYISIKEEKIKNASNTIQI